MTLFGIGKRKDTCNRKIVLDFHTFSEAQMSKLPTVPYIYNVMDDGITERYLRIELQDCFRYFL